MFLADGLLAINGAFFLIRAIVLIMVENVPQNIQLRDSGKERGQVCERCLEKCVFWDHVRKASAVVSGRLHAD